MEKMNIIVGEIVDSFEKAQSNNEPEMLSQLHLIEAQIEAFIDLDRKINDLGTVQVSATVAGTETEKKIPAKNFQQYYVEETKSVREEIRGELKSMRNEFVESSRREGLIAKQFRKDKIVSLNGRRMMNQLAKPGLKKAKAQVKQKD